VLVLVLVCVIGVTHGAPLYGLGAAVPALETIDTVTGRQTPVGAPIPNELTGQQLSSIDDKNRLFYVVAFNTTDRHIYLISLSLQTGALVKSTRLPFAESELVGVGQTCNVMPESGHVLVTGRDRILGKHFILDVDPVAGTNTVIASIGDIDVLASASAYDHVNKVLWLQFALQNGGIYNFAFEIPSGKILHQINDNLNLETMDFDSRTGKILGIGLYVVSNQNYTRVLVSLDSKTGIMSIVGYIPDYFLLQGGEAGLNVVGRELYCFMMPKGNNNVPFNLLTLNADTGAVKSKPPIPANQQPWSIAYYANP